MVRDIESWKLNPNEDFSTKSAYWLTNQGANTGTWEWAFIWRLQIPPRIKTFIWLVAKGKILTNFERAKRRMRIFMYCPMGCRAIEDLNHLFRTTTKNSRIGLIRV